MANGDAAAAAGLPVVPSTKDIRLGYDDINKLADALAQHMTAGGHAYSKISGKPETFASSWDTTSGRPEFGFKAGPTDTIGTIPIAHSLGRVPLAVLIQAAGPPFSDITEEVARLAEYVVTAKTSTHITVRVKRGDTNQWFPSQGVAFFYVAF